MVEAQAEIVPSSVIFTDKAPTNPQKTGLSTTNQDTPDWFVKSYILEFSHFVID